jgi:hypothetical protein
MAKRKNVETVSDEDFSPEITEEEIVDNQEDFIVEPEEKLEEVVISTVEIIKAGDTVEIVGFSEKEFNGKIFKVKSIDGAFANIGNATGWLNFRLDFLRKM